MKPIMTVRYISGRSEKFELEPKGSISANKRLRELTENPTLVLRSGPQITIIPGTGIETIVIDATDEALDQLEVPSLRIVRQID